MRPDACPDSSALFAMLDEPDESTAYTETRLHVSRCSACTAAMRELAALVSGAREPLRTYPTESLVTRLDAAVAAEQRRSSRRVPWGRVVAALGAAAAAAAMIALVPGLQSNEAEQMTPRGQAGASSARRDVHVALDVVSRTRAGTVDVNAATADTATSPDAHLLVSYATTGARAAFRLLCFAVDAKGEVHWLYPAYHDASTDPESLLLPPGKSLTPMATEAVLDELAPGRVRVFALVSARPLHVSDVERLPVSALEQSMLAARFEEVDVRTWEIEIDGKREGGTP